ncbi:RNA methyltransferase [Phototrophicus methaneseepsis]|uniref:RNA methyltransferase n=1 Tax=Phototrophicus methaneseepsis TaxID=2710758 RepID=A0A7S8E7V9_9CHLR|nr:RNA methyltransferase [Phototrophicus methaneseepsis]QPC82008.1 RNA methyltransferase [Phototrophicus methaneseepsis]
MVEQITSTQNQRVKLTKTLQTKARARRGERKMVLEGHRLIGDALSRNRRPLFAFYSESNEGTPLLNQLRAAGTELLPASDDVVKYVSDTENTSGLVGVFTIPMPELPNNPLRMLVLDAVREPGNMGTILRTAGAAGVELVILSPGCVDPYNPKVLRSGMGAHFRVPIVEASWQEIATFCESTQIFVATGDAEERYTSVDWTQPWTLIIGNEAHGVSDNARALGGIPVAIPMAESTESLNAAGATAVILFEAVRQRSIS